MILVLSKSSYKIQEVDVHIHMILVLSKWSFICDLNQLQIFSNPDQIVPSIFSNAYFLLDDDVIYIIASLILSI